MKNILFWAGIIIFLAGGVFFVFASLDQTKGGVQESIHSLQKEKEIYSTPAMNSKGTEDTKPEKKEFILYYDFTCPHCREFYTDTFTPLQKSYSDEFSFSILPFPLQTTDTSLSMAQSFVCVQNVKNQKSAYALVGNEAFESDINEIWNIISFTENEGGEFASCMDSEESINTVLEIRSEAIEKGVRGTPTFFIDGEKFEKNQAIQKVELSIAKILAQ